ncbi:DUF6629 family protein [Flavobacterium subsaxonicum]|uniref:DUF6629 family protein n=1 Tax=Flavobacterium subsaxonicum TaxID=426226 RepID=UPI0003F79657|nr:DUF6629 family protein [Flavobacterium subsaxonicum]
MCFSASASFTAASVLLLIGIATVIKVSNPKQYLFAAIPLLFSLQQFVEGLLWIVIPKSGYDAIAGNLTYLYLFFAEVTWPVWIPLSLLFLEDNVNRKALIRIFLLAGIVVATYLAFYILTYSVKAAILNCHILYLQHLHSPYSIIGSWPYLFATIVPFFISGNKNIRVMGVLIVVSYLISKWFYDSYLLSVWCFYAAIASAAIYTIISKFTVSKTVKKSSLNSQIVRHEK